ncbi:MAG: DMT family transporter [Leptolyngbya sp. DLM2.Bin27]|nr:MAG: DMT family transporter [Leptolyngbya sp. DLM2.Bin27]
MVFFLLMGTATLLGVGSSISGAINSFIGREIGLIRATFLFLSLGTALSGLLMLGFDDRLPWSGLVDLLIQRPYLLAPGLLNALMIMVIIRVTALVGTTLTMAALFSGQMLISLWLDQVGFAGLRVIPITPLRVMAVICLLVGVILLNVERFGQPPLSPIHVTALPPRLTPPRPTALPVLAVLAVGGLLSGASSINAALGQAAGVFTATLFFLGPGVLLLPLLGLAIAPQATAADLPPWRPLYLMPGILNVLYIAGSVVLVPLLGVQTLISAVFTAKICTGLAIDRCGWLGLPRSPITARRLLAAGLLVAGVVLSSAPS